MGINNAPAKNHLGIYLFLGIFLLMFITSFIKCERTPKQAFGAIPQTSESRQAIGTHKSYHVLVAYNIRYAGLPGEETKTAEIILIASQSPPYMLIKEIAARYAQDNLYGGALVTGSVNASTATLVKDTYCPTCPRFLVNDPVILQVDSSSLVR